MRVRSVIAGQLGVVERWAKALAKASSLSWVRSRCPMPASAYRSVISSASTTEELQEERPELSVHGIHVELVDHPGGLHDPRVGRAVGVTATLGTKQRGLLLRPPGTAPPPCR